MLETILSKIENSIHNEENSEFVSRKEYNRLLDLLKKKNQEIVELKERFKYLNQNFDLLYDRVLNNEHLLMCLTHDIHGVPKTYQNQYDSLRVQHLKQRIGLSEPPKQSLIQKVKGKCKNLKLNMKIWFLQQRSRKKVTYQEVERSTGLNYRTIRKAFQSMISILPGVFELRKINPKEKALCLVNPEKFYNNCSFY